MKPSELRIGNLVYGRSKKIAEVDIYSLTIFAQWEDSKYSQTPPFRPISLTEGWLLKFGFDWDKRNYLLKDLGHAKMELGFFGGAYDKMTLLQKDNQMPFGLNHPEYVHQLQNLYFTLTGEELTIKELA